MFGGSVLPGEDNKTGRKRRRRFDFDAEWSIGPRSTAWDALWARLLSCALDPHPQPDTKQGVPARQKSPGEASE